MTKEQKTPVLKPDEESLQQTPQPSSPSARSQKSLFLERQLRDRIRKFMGAKVKAEQQIPELEKEKADLARKLVLTDNPRVGIDLRMIEVRFHDTVLQLDNARALISSCEQHCAENHAAIEKLIPTPEQLQSRLQRQQQFAQLAVDRLARDRQADSLIKRLRQVLDERNGLTAEMVELACSLDLTVALDDLDESRFEDLRNSLPAEQVSASERWCDWFIENRPSATPYIVVDAELVVRETLTHAGVYSFGETIRLPEEEARELLREDRPAPTEIAPWRRKPPSIMTVEAYAALSKAAEEEGISIHEKLFWLHLEREAELEEAYKVVPIEGRR